LPRRLVFLGTPALAVIPFAALLEAGFDVLFVVTREDARRGRGRDVTPSPVKVAAQAAGIPVSHRVDDVLQTGADLGVVVAFGQLIKPHVLHELPMVNVHFSLLPRWRGAAPVERALLAGDTETGTCLMQVEEGLDTGPVFDTVTVPIEPRVTADELRRILADAGAEQLVRCLRAGLRDPVAQHGTPTYAAKLHASELEIDWAAAAGFIDRLVRVGGAWTTFRGRRLKIVEAEPVDAEPGESEPAAAAAPVGTLRAGVVSCGTGGLRLRRVQPEGKAVMDFAAWANGAKPRPGESLGGAPDG
jgi:methionyl-tRNA formyltransferase